MEPSPRRGVAFAIVSFALFMAAIDNTIVATALRPIQHDLHAQLNWSGWTITIYSLGQLVSMPLAGKISDQYGRKKVFLSCAALFVFASLCCCLAQNIYQLVAFRALQSLGGGAFMPSATGIVADHFGKERDRALGLLASVLPIGGAIGPIVGGVVVTYWSWREIFLVNVPVGILLVVLGAKFIPPGARKDSGRPDLLGIGLVAVTILSGMYGVTRLGTADVTLLDPRFLVAEAVALLGGWLFLVHTKRAPAPYIPLKLLRGKGFGMMNVVNFLYGGAALGMAALLPLYATARFGISTLESGTLLTALAIGTVVAAGITVVIMRRTGYRRPIFVGLAVIALGLIAMAVGPHGLSPYLWLAIAAGVLGFGQGSAMPATNNASLQLAPERAAAIAGLRGLFRQGGSIIAVSVTTAILARSDTPGLTQAYALAAFAVALACLLPFIRFVPEYRGSW